MAEEKPSSDSVSADKSPSPSKLKSMLVIAFIGIVTVIETGMFFFLVPSAEEISALAEARLIETVKLNEENAVKESTDENQVIEFPLGTFGETFSPIDTDRAFRVEMRLYGLIRAKDKDKMAAEFAAKGGRIRHSVRMKVRNSELAELQDNQLGLLERRLLTECNHVLDEEMLLGIGFNDYQLIE